MLSGSFNLFTHFFLKNITQDDRHIPVHAFATGYYRRRRSGFAHVMVQPDLLGARGTCAPAALSDNDLPG